MKNIILTPGPVPLSQKTQQILGEQVWHHRIPAFNSVLASSLGKLKELFCCEGHVFILNSSGSGAMEAGLVNFLSPGDRVLSIVSGKFGQRWQKMAQCFGIEVDCLSVRWGSAVELGELKNRLKKTRYQAVLTQACETSTGVLHPIEGIAAAIAATQTPDTEKTLLIVDGITAVGALPLSMSELNIDVLIGGSQKAFALPTGLSFVGCSQFALDTMAESKCVKYYFDLAAELACNGKNQTQFSSATSMIRALENNLDQMFTKGLKTHYAEIQTLSDKTKKAFADIGMTTFSDRPSPSLSAVRVSENLDSAKIREHLEQKYGFTIMGGQDQLKGKILRVGHMGEISFSDMADFFTALVASVNELYPDSISEQQLQRALGYFV